MNKYEKDQSRNEAVAANFCEYCDHTRGNCICNQGICRADFKCDKCFDCDNCGADNCGAKYCTACGAGKNTSKTKVLPHGSKEEK